MTTTETPPIPEHVARYFAEIVRFTTSKAYQRWNRVFEFKDLQQEAWIIAAQRWQGWSDQKAMARKDLTFALDRWIKQRLPELGWMFRMQSDGRRRWVPVQGTIPYDPQVQSMDDYSVPWDEGTEKCGHCEGNEDCEYCEGTEGTADCERSLSGWAPMGRAQRERYARILFERYPVLVAEFELVENQVKPVKLAHAVWVRRQERTKAGLRVKYATELATARYAVEGFVSEELAA